MKKPYTVITCPKCGTEYLPAEIYTPNGFLGKPNNIAKHNGKLISFYGDTMDLKERYICDCCETPLIIRANVSFNAVVDEQSNFSEEYSSPLKKAQFIMDEDV